MPESETPAPDAARRTRPPGNLTDELARERNREAADRTLLAWIRTSLALISFGIGLERVGQAALGFEARGAEFSGRLSPLTTRGFGAALVILGVAATLAGMWEHRLVLRSISHDDYRYANRPAIARSMGMALVVVGLAALGVILAGL